MVTRSAVLFVLMLLVSSCGPGVQIKQEPHGWTARLDFRNGSERTAELLAVDSARTIVLVDTGVQVISNELIARVHISKPVERTLWIIYDVVGVIGAGLFGITRADHEYSDFGVAGTVAVVMGTIAAGLLIVSEPRESYKWPIDGSALSDIQLFARYPYGLTKAQLDELIASSRK